MARSTKKRAHWKRNRSYRVALFLKTKSGLLGIVTIIIIIIISQPTRQIRVFCTKRSLVKMYAISRSQPPELKEVVVVENRKVFGQVIPCVDRIGSPPKWSWVAYSERSEMLYSSPPVRPASHFAKELRRVRTYTSSTQHGSFGGCGREWVRERVYWTRSHIFSYILVITSDASQSATQSEHDNVWSINYILYYPFQVD